MVVCVSCCSSLYPVVLFIVTGDKLDERKSKAARSHHYAPFSLRPVCDFLTVSHPFVSIYAKVVQRLGNCKTDHLAV